MIEEFRRIRPKVSVVIPSWFKPDQDGKYGSDETFWFAVECLKKFNLATNKEECELIIIDNGSTLTNKYLEGKHGTPLLSHLSATPDWYWSNADILIRNQKNLGFGPACNQGFNLARGEYIICLNNDIIVFPGWLEALIEPFAQELNPPAGVVMPALVKEVKDARQALEIDMPDLSQNYNSLGPQAEFGSCWIMKKSLMDEIRQKDGFIFNEIFQVGFGEDRDLWDRVRRMGYETYRIHKTRVFHQGNMSMSKIPNRRVYTEANREIVKKFKEERDKNN